MPKSAGQCTVPFAVSAWLMASQNWPNSARTLTGSVWVMMSASARVGSTRCMLRCTVTDVAWFTLAQPTAAAAAGEDAAGEDAAADASDGEAPAAATDETVAEPHPASAEHSSTASTVPRTSRGDIMLL
jgi:hypothetical protein